MEDLFDNSSFEEDINNQTPQTNEDPSKWEEGKRTASSLSEVSGDKKPRKNYPNVSVSLSSNLSAYTVPYSELEENLQAAEKIDYVIDGIPSKIELQRDIIKQRFSLDSIVDKHFKPIRYTNQEQKLCFALSYLLTSELEYPRLNFLINETEDPKNTDLLFYRMDVDFSVLAKLLRGRTSARDKEFVKDLLISVTGKIGIYKKKIKTNGTTKVFYFASPLVNMDGMIFTETITESGIKSREYYGMTIRLSRAFFDNIRNKNTPLNPQTFKLWKDSPLFSNLLFKINELWYYSWVGFTSAEQTVVDAYKKKTNNSKVKPTDIPDLDVKINQEKYKSIHKSLEFGRIYTITEEDYNSTKQKRLRFRNDLKKYFDIFQTLGLISSYEILPKEERIRFVINPNYKGKGIEDNKTQSQ